VAWCWWDYCHPIYDPRPVYCRPAVYAACSPVFVFNYPYWEPLQPEAGCTWVDVPPVVVAPAAQDLQLLAVRFVDAGHPDERLGPRYRVWFRNNAARDITEPFNVSIIASNDETLGRDLPQAGLRVERVGAAETRSVDLRLPWEVYSMNRDAAGDPAPFATLHAVVDSHLEITETREDNNGAVLDRGDILPVDPAAFSTDAGTVVEGGAVSIAGEGFGPEPGRVLVYVDDRELDAEILGWFDLGVRARMPVLPLANPRDAEIVVIRGDGAAANPLRVKLAPRTL
jgi:hypothetical protein